MFNRQTLSNYPFDVLMLNKTIYQNLLAALFLTSFFRSIFRYYRFPIKDQSNPQTARERKLIDKSREIAYNDAPFFITLIGHQSPDYSVAGYG